MDKEGQGTVIDTGGGVTTVTVELGAGKEETGDKNIGEDDAGGNAKQSPL